MTKAQRNLLATPPPVVVEGQAPIPNAETRAAWLDLFSKPIAGGPIACGFDSYFGTDIPNFPPYCFIENDHTVGIPDAYLGPSKLKGHLASLQGPALKDWKFEEILPTLGERAAKFISESVAKSEPFLLYLPLTSPHTPLAANEEWRGKSGLNAYADFVMETDAVVGRVLDALEKSGAADNTLVVFTSDNGCSPDQKAMEMLGHYPSGPHRGYKFSVWEGGHRIPFIVRWPGHVKPGGVCRELVQQPVPNIFRDQPEQMAQIVKALQAILQADSSVACRAQAVTCLAELRQDPGILIAALGDKEAAVRLAAAQGLCNYERAQLQTAIR